MKSEKEKDVYLEYHDDDRNSHKFYRVTYTSDLSGEWALVEWGRIGTAGESKDYSLHDAFSKVEEKLAKGYKVQPHSARERFEQEQRKRIEQMYLLPNGEPRREYLATIKALEAFWLVIAESFPEIKSGDIPFYTGIRFESIALDMVDDWVRDNA